MCKLLYGLEGAILHSATGSFAEMDHKADMVMLDAGHTLVAGGEFTGRTFIVLLINANGSTSYARHYTVGH